MSTTHSSLELKPNRGAHRLRIAMRWIAAAGFIGAGVKHFTNANFFRLIVPPGFPNPAALVAISGICEIAGGAGLLIRPLRRPAGWGLILLLIAVFPANIYMALAPQRIPDMHIPRWLLWLRLPLQGLLVAWVRYVAFDKPVTYPLMSDAGKDDPS